MYSRDEKSRLLINAKAPWQATDTFDLNCIDTTAAHSDPTYEKLPLVTKGRRTESESGFSGGP